MITFTLKRMSVTTATRHGGTITTGNNLTAQVQLTTNTGGLVGQTLLVGEGCSRVCHITNSASGGRGVAGFVALQTQLVGVRN